MWSLRRLSIAPVKSLGLHHPHEAWLDEAGVAGDRVFLLVDAAGGLFSGADHGPLVQVRADHDREAEMLRLAFPDGRVAEGDAAALGEATATDFYGRMVQGRIVEGPFSDGLSIY